ncbi:MAG: hypothetical protein NVS9B15_05240 [Acidobacteriaceae bacterium]
MYVLGIALCLALMFCSRHFSDRGGPCFMAALTIGEIAYLLAVRELFAATAYAKRVVCFGLVLAAVWHAAFLLVPTPFDDDVHRYVWDGRVQRLGYNPYVVIPNDLTVQALHTSETRSLNNSELPSLYPPGAQLFFRVVTSVHESTFAMRVAFVLCEIAIALLLLVAWPGERRRYLVLAFAWNPLLAIEVTGSGHVDILGAFLLLVSAVALARKWRTVAAVTLGLALAVKFLPIVLLPLYWRRVRVRDAAMATLVVALLYIPFLEHGHLATGSLGIYIRSFRFNGPVFAALDRIAPPQVLAGLALLAGLAVATWLRRSEPEPTSADFAWPMAASLLCAPAVFPWYLLWLTPFLRSRTTLLLVLWTASIIPTYVMWHLRALGHSWGSLPSWVMVVEYGSLMVAAAIIHRERLRRMAMRSVLTKWRHSGD